MTYAHDLRIWHKGGLTLVASHSILGTPRFLANLCSLFLHFLLEQFLCPISIFDTLPRIRIVGTFSLVLLFANFCSTPLFFCDYRLPNHSSPEWLDIMGGALLGLSFSTLCLLVSSPLASCSRTSESSRIMEVAFLPLAVLQDHHTGPTSLRT